MDREAAIGALVLRMLSDDARPAPAIWVGALEPWWAWEGNVAGRVILSARRLHDRPSKSGRGMLRRAEVPSEAPVGSSSSTGEGSTSDSSGGEGPPAVCGDGVCEASERAPCWATPKEAWCFGDCYQDPACESVVALLAIAPWRRRCAGRRRVGRRWPYYSPFMSRTAGLAGENAP